MRFLPYAIPLVLFLCAPIALGQQLSERFITVEGEVTRPLRLTVKELEKYPTHELKAKDKQGREHSYKGTLLALVLDSAGVTLGAQLKGDNLAKCVLVKAADGYEVIYSLAEIDPELSANTILLATQVDGKPLPAGEGPFRIVNPSDTRPARWIREISSIKILFPGD